MQFIEIVGTKEQLRKLNDIEGLEMPRGSQDIGGGRFKAKAFVRRQSAIAEIQARGLTVTVTMDEEEVQRRIDNERESIRRSSDAGAALTQPSSTDQPSSIGEGEKPGDPKRKA